MRVTTVAIETPMARICPPDGPSRNSITASAMPQARTHKVEQRKQDNKKPSNLLGFFCLKTKL
jgi:hypothetical protein